MHTHQREVKAEIRTELPTEFKTQMISWLGQEFNLFAQAYTRPAERALRLHRYSYNWTLPQDKANVQTTSGEKGYTSPYALHRTPLPAPDGLHAQLGDAVPWLPDAFYIPSFGTLGKQVYHEAGAYYIQEPSAMAVVAALNPQPGERILDLAAAPGGKTTAIGKAMQAHGLLVANEIHPARVLVLAQNIERCGVPAVVANETPQRLAQFWGGEFDAVLVDAPCSGEGMFRKDEMAVKEWTADACIACSSRQRDILKEAIRMVRPGGRLVYSTCTFNPIENEQVIAWAVQEFHLTVQELPVWEGWEPGRPEWCDGFAEISHTRRLWPHKGRGEGHFVALLKTSEVPFSYEGHEHRRFERRKKKDQRVNTQKGPRPFSPSEQSQWVNWLQELVRTDLPQTWTQPVLVGSHVFADERGGLPTEGLRVLRPGTALATINNGRFEAHHNLAMAIHPDLVTTLSVSEPEALAYLAGQTLQESSTQGFVLVTFEGLALGWGKSVPGRTNNLYPKGLRRTDLTPTP